MAYVSISSDLVSTIRSSITTLRETELNSLAPLDKFDEAVKSDQSLKDMIVERQWGDLKDLRDRLSPYDRDVTVKIEIACTYLMNGYDVHAKRSMELGVLKLPCFAKYKEHWGSVSLNLEFKSTDHPVFEPLAEVISARDECTRRWKAVEEQVVKFVGECKSLNEAVKLWPDLRRYLDRDYLERLDKKVERTKPEESKAAAALKAVNVDLVNSSVVLARMAGAKV